MSKWPERRVSLPQDQPMRYFAFADVRDSGFFVRKVSREMKGFVRKQHA